MARIHNLFAYDSGKVQQDLRISFFSKSIPSNSLRNFEKGVDQFSQGAHVKEKH